MGTGMELLMKCEIEAARPNYSKVRTGASELTASRGAPRGTRRFPGAWPVAALGPVLSGRALRALSGKGTPVRFRLRL